METLAILGTLAIMFYVCLGAVRVSAAPTQAQIAARTAKPKRLSYSTLYRRAKRDAYKFNLEIQRLDLKMRPAHKPTPKRYWAIQTAYKFGYMFQDTQPIAEVTSTRFQRFLSRFQR